MSYMFSGCSSLNNLPDISKWDTKNVTDMSGMFRGCSKLKKMCLVCHYLEKISLNIIKVDVIY